jgi:hypothetical protein
MGMCADGGNVKGFHHRGHGDTLSQPSSYKRREKDVTTKIRIRALNAAKCRGV